MAYEIWRDDSLNLSASFDTKDAALAALRTEIDKNGPELVAHATLALVDRLGRRRTYAEGQDLVAKVMAYPRLLASASVESTGLHAIEPESWRRTAAG